MPITVKASAKINLTLDVLDKRPDGYHNVDMVMQSIDIFDLITLETVGFEGIGLACTDKKIPTDASNTAHKAASLFLEHTGIKKGVSIYINKQIPSQAGLAGGSADAAAVLHGMNKLFNTGISVEVLAQLGSWIGADVPFCVYGGTMHATGIGTNLKRLNSMPECYYVVVKPPVDISTAEAYKKCDARKDIPAEPHSEKMIKAIQKGDLFEIAANLYNDFEEVAGVFLIDQIKNTFLKKGALGALMTGSGSAIYGLFDDREKSLECARLVNRTMSGCEVFAAKNSEFGCVVS